MHEASLYEDNVFLTLTYRDEELPEYDSLKLEHWQLFMKRLKKRYGGKKIRFYHCGEYGETTGRPHYHAILFNHTFNDQKFLKKTETDQNLFTSQLLDQIWSHGDCYIGTVTFESAAYCGRYVMKKLTGARKSEYGNLLPEYSTMSRRPGIGSPWLAKWKTDVYPNDFCIINGLRVRVPKAYDTTMANIEYKPSWKYDENHVPYYIGPALKRSNMELLKAKRKKAANKHADNNTPERLAVREELTRLRIERLARK